MTNQLQEISERAQSIVKNYDESFNEMFDTLMQEVGIAHDELKTPEEQQYFLMMFNKFYARSMVEFEKKVNSI